jgi:CBS domain-containing protein
MRVRDLMISPVLSVDDEATVADAAETLARRQVDLLPVTRGGELVGVLTCRDIVVRSTAAGADPVGTRVDSVMSRRVIHCSVLDEVDRALRLMRAHRLHSLPVTDRGWLVGLVSLTDLISTAALAVEPPVLKVVC